MWACEQEGKMGERAERKMDRVLEETTGLRESMLYIEGLPFSEKRRGLKEGLGRRKEGGNCD